MKKSLRGIASGVVTALIVSMMSIAFTTTTASPAQAAVSIPTGWANVKYTGGVRTYGTTFRAVGNWAWSYGGQGGGVPAGSVYLQFRANASSAWHNVAVDRSPSTFDLRHRIGRSGTHRLVYTGGRDANGNYYQKRASGPMPRMAVKRKITVKLHKRRFALSGRVTPQYKRKPVFLVKVRGPKATKGHKVKRVRTDRRGRYTVKVPKRARRTYYRMWTPRGGDYVRGFSGKWVKTWRRHGRPVVNGGGDAGNAVRLSGGDSAKVTEYLIDGSVGGRVLAGETAPRPFD